jgi:hypothetical protein
VRAGICTSSGIANYRGTPFKCRFVQVFLDFL